MNFSLRIGFDKSRDAYELELEKHHPMTNKIFKNTIVVSQREHESNQFVNVLRHGIEKLCKSIDVDPKEVLGLLSEFNKEPAGETEGNK